MKISKRDYNIKTYFLIPERIISFSECELQEMLLEEHPRQAMLDNSPITLIKKGGYILFDFGKEIQGGADITIRRAKEGTDMRIVFGESVSEAMSNIGENNATNDHAIRDTVVKVTDWQHFRTWNTGFRFLKLEAVNGDIHIAGVQAAAEIRDLEYKGSFKCNDSLLNKIWEVGAYTVHLNMQEYLWDGIKRDRLVWIGDMHPETSTILAVFGETEVVKDSLDLIRDNTPCNEWMNTIPSYNMWWIRIHYDWYMETGDIDYLKEQSEYLFEVIKHTIALINDDGTHNIDGLFVDWSSKNTKEEAAGMQAMLVQGMIYGGKLCDILNNNKLSEMCKETERKLRKQLYCYEGNKQIAAMVSLTDMGDCEQISKLLKTGGAKGLSTFWGYYTLQALAKTNDYTDALNIIRNYWGLMIKFGATTFWEHFDVDWTDNAVPIDEIVPEGKRDIHAEFGCFCYKQLRLSLCHGWASGPTAFLSKNILGVECIKPGYKEVRITPHLGDLKWVEGTYPTPYGNIKIRHENKDGNVVSEIDAPDEIKVYCE